MASEERSEIENSFDSIVQNAEEYFEEASKMANLDEYNSDINGDFVDAYWNQLTLEMQSTAMKLVERILPLCASVADLARSSALTGSEDVNDIKMATKSIRAALTLRRYSYIEPDVIHDEGMVLGFQPARQNVDVPAKPDEAKESFLISHAKIQSVLKLIEATKPGTSMSELAVSREPNKYRADTAFVMMWMDPKKPELTDAINTVRSVFESFGIRAVRADEIEHEGLITERIINEIRTSEFLFADLTGMRPNVYYEVGYAHALGKRVILFRKTGTGLHFDLSGYNCPEYENFTELRNKLKNRLISITNRNPTKD